VFHLQDFFKEIYSA